MKKHFRTTEIYTSHNATTPVEIDSGWLPDFKGSTEQEFFDYISENMQTLVDEDEDSGLSEEALKALGELVYGERKEYYNSCVKYFEGEIQMGEINEKLVKNGEFETQYSIDFQ